jgi:biopolymer transport protein ExbB/TolQ
MGVVIVLVAWSWLTLLVQVLLLVALLLEVREWRRVRRLALAVQHELSELQGVAEWRRARGWADETNWRGFYA